MSVLQYPKNQYYIIADSTSVNLGRFASVSGLLGLFQLRILNKVTTTYSYTMRVVFSATEGGTALYSTAWETFSNATTGQTTNCWLGNVTFDVSQYRLNSSVGLHARLELTGYTRNALVTYLGINCDWHEPIGNANTAGARMTMGVYV